MGIALARNCPSRGERRRAILNQTEDAWLLIFAALGLSLAIAGVRQAVLLTILFSDRNGVRLWLAGDFSDIAVWFWDLRAGFCCRSALFVHGC